MKAFTPTLALTLLLPSLLHAADLLGAGASLPQSLYGKWANAYQESSKHRVTYQSIGSGSGITQIIGKSVDFAATDIPVAKERLSKENLLQIPVALSGVVPILNLPDIATEEVKLSGEVLANIYLGKITKWNDAAIQALNQGLTLPSLSIVVIHRSDSNSSTFLWTQFLTKLSPAWQERVGHGSTVVWPIGLGGKGDVGISHLTQRLPGAIAYVDYGYAQSAQLKTPKLLNRDGQFVNANETSLRAAIGKPEGDDALYNDTLIYQTGAQAWPITSATFVVVRKHPAQQQQTAQVIKFIEWAQQNGKSLTQASYYVPLPDTVIQVLPGYWSTLLKPASSPTDTSAATSTDKPANTTPSS